MRVWNDPCAKRPALWQSISSQLQARPQWGTGQDGLVGKNPAAITPVASGRVSSFPANQGTPWPTGQRHISVRFRSGERLTGMSPGRNCTAFGRPRSPTRDRKHSHQIDERNFTAVGAQPILSPTSLSSPLQLVMVSGIMYLSGRRAKPARGHRIRRRARGQRRGPECSCARVPRAS